MKIKKQKDGVVHVEICHTHYSHQIELQHIWLTRRYSSYTN